MRATNKVIDKLLLLTAVVFFVFHFYTAYFGALPRDEQRPVHLGLLMIFFFLGKLAQTGRKRPLKVLDFVLMIGCTASLVYLVVIWDELQSRLGLIVPADMVFGTILIVGLLVVTTQIVGKSLTIVTACFIFYGFFGQYFPGFLRHAGFTYQKFINLTYISTEGIFGTTFPV